MEKKLTKKEMYNMILNVKEVSENDEMVKFIEHELELLNKKSGSKVTAKQIENEGVKNEILSVLTTSENPMTISEIVKELKNEYSNQKISALTKQLVADEKVKREMVKKVAYFSCNK